MTTYNMDFLIAAVIIVGLIIIHFMTHNSPDDMNGKIFIVLAFMGMADIIFELISSYYIDGGRGSYGIEAEFFTTVFYMLQVMLPFALVIYTESLRETSMLSPARIFRWGIPTAVMLFIILTNTFTGKLFYFDPSKGYIKGSWYLLTYIFALINVLLAIFIAIRGRKELKGRKIGALIEIFILCTAGILVQLKLGYLLTTGFGLSLCIMVMFFTLNNPYANTDNLTGLYDKTYFNRQCREMMAAKQPFHIIEMEFYQLKRINQVAGSQYGDYLIQQVAGKLKDLYGKRVFRVSGKRFILLVDSLREYEDCLDQMEDMFNSMRQVDDTQIEFPVILSGVINANRMKSPEEIQDYTEYLCSLASRSGRMELVQEDEQTREGFEYSKKVEKFLYQAIDEDLFEVYFQPIYSLKEKQFMAVEALSRLNHPELGFIPPDLFIRLAEKNGLITKITNLQLHRICRFLKSHPNLMKKIRNVKINLSPLDLMTKDSGQDKIDIIRFYGIPCEWFQMEITETVATKYRENLLKAVEVFEKAGIGLCLDDFGSGYANFNTVMQLPFNVIKLDKSLLFNIKEDQKTSAFYKSIVDAFKNMGYDLVSEGVETRDEMELLEKWGVDYIQGYYYSKPLPARELMDFLKNNTI